MTLNTVVTGVGRSGTAFVCKVLKAAGVSCGHEGAFNCAGFDQGTHLAIDVSWLAVPFLSRLPAGTRVFHQVRDPIKVIQSHHRIRFFGSSSPFRDFAKRYCPAAFEGPPIEQAVRFWIYWNQMVEGAQHLGFLRYERHRLEDVDWNKLWDISGLYGVEEAATLTRALSETPTDVNTRGDRSRDRVGFLRKLPPDLYRELQIQARRYGYVDGL